MKGYKEQSIEYGSKGNQKAAFINPATYPGMVWKPKWNKTDRLETHFRPVGATNSDGTEFMPWRYGPDSGEYTPWIIRIPLIIFGSSKVYSCIPAYADPNSRGDSLNTEMHPTPITEFFDNAKRMAKDDVNLKHLLLEGSDKNAPSLPRRIGSVGLIQGIMLRHGTNDYYRRPRYPSLLVISSSACNALEDVLNKETEGYKGDPTDFNARFACGDVLGSKTGRALVFYNALTQKVSDVPAENDTANIDWSKTNQKDSKASTEFAHYACELGKKVVIPTLANGKIGLPGPHPLFMPWETVLRHMNDAEMVDVICRAFSDMPALVVTCLRAYKHLIPKHIRGDAQVVVPSGVPAPTVAAQTQPTKPVPAADEADVDWGGGGAEPANSKEPDMMDRVTPEDLGTAGGEPEQKTTPAAASSAVPSDAQARIQEAMRKLDEVRKAAAGK